MRWPTFSIAYLSDVVTKGTTPTTLGRVFVDQGINFIKAEALNGECDLDPAGFSFIDEETHEHLKRSILHEDDVLITIAGANVGKCGFVQRHHLPANTNQAVGIVRAKKAHVSPRFIYYFFKQPTIRNFIQSLSGQAAQPNLNLANLKKILIPLPPKSEQEQIVVILSAYDFLIQNHCRRIQLLEESARLLFKEWFVHFRFPGHEHVKMVNGVPEGWRKVSLRNLAVLNYGKALKADNRQIGSIPVYGSSGIVGYHNNALVKGPGIIIGRKGNVGSIYWSYTDFFPIDTVYFIDAKSSNYYLYHALQNIKFISTDVAVPGLNRDFAYSKTLVMPNKILLNEFEKIVTLLYRQINILHQCNQKLTEARDILLPKLMNGDISV